MANIPAKRKPNRCPSHPGALLREVVVPATGRTKIGIANLLGISRQQHYDILREAKPLSPTVAVRLGKLFGDGAAVWLRMQAAQTHGTLSERLISAQFRRYGRHEASA